MTNIISGLKSLSSFLRNESSRFSHGPILLITSQADRQVGGRSSTKVDEVCRFVSFVLQQQLNFRTVVAHPCSAGYSFPTPSDIRLVSDLATRVGATTVAAVGSGSAIDLAKAIVQNRSSTMTTPRTSLNLHESNFHDLVLVPATYVGVFVSGTSHSLLLDTAEEELDIFPKSCEATQSTIRTTIVNVDPFKIETNSMWNVTLGATSTILDRLVRQDGGSLESDERLLIDAFNILCRIHKLETLSEKEIVTIHEDLNNFLFRSARCVSFGFGNTIRSVPLAIASSLITKNLTHHNMIDVMASLVPALCTELAGEHSLRRETSAILDTFMSQCLNSVPIVVAAGPVDHLLSEIHSNQSFWNCLDASDIEFRTTLKNSVLS